MGVLSANYDEKVGFSDQLSHLLLPLSGEGLRYGTVDECKGRLRLFRLGNEVAGQVTVVVVVEADEDALSGQLLVSFPPGKTMAGDCTSPSDAMRGRIRLRATG